MDLASLKDLKETQKMKTDVEHLKQKLSKENAKIIKLKPLEAEKESLGLFHAQKAVGQDTAYWELEEKLSTTERHHATLQRNMVELQMEHEAVSAQYQEELRQRPETLNKLQSTRAICDALEENLCRVRVSLQRSATDRAALADAYARAGAAVAAATADNEKRLTAAASEARHARDLGAHLMESMSRERSRAEQAAAEAERLRKQQDVYNEQLARYDALVQEKDKTIQEIRDEFRRAMSELNERYERATNVIRELERQAGATPALRAALSQAEARGEAAARDVARLTADLAALQLAKDEVTKQAATYSLQIEEFQSHDDEMKKGMQLLTKIGEDLAQKLKGKDEEIRLLTKALDESKQETYKLAERAAMVTEEHDRERCDFEKREIERDQELHDCKQRIANAQNELVERNNAIDNLLREIAELKETNARTEAIFAEQKTALELERGVSEKHATATENKLAEYAELIDRLKNDIEVEREQHSKDNVALAKLTTVKEQESREYEDRVKSVELKATELSDTIAELKRELAAVTAARELAETTLKQMEAERSLEREAFEKHATEAEQELTKSENSIIHYKTKLTLEAEERTRLESALETSREDLNGARKELGRALEDVRNLKADCRRKEDEATKQLQIILSMKAEKEVMQNKIGDLEDTIKNIQKITQTPQAPPNNAPPAPGFRREPPEHDDNAMAASPAQFRELNQPTSGATRAPTPTILTLFQQNATRNNSEMYNLFSDSSDSLNAYRNNRNIAGRFDSPTEIPFSPIPPSASSVKRRRASGQRQTTQSENKPRTASQLPAATRPEDKQRKFFKTKRSERTYKK